MKEKLLNFCREKNILLSEGLLNLFGETNDFESIKVILEKSTISLNKKFITEKTIIENKIFFYNLFNNSPLKKDKIFSKLSSFFELDHIEGEKIVEQPKVKVKSSLVYPGKVLEVKDFVEYFKSRYKVLSAVLSEKYELENLTSIGKLNGEKQKISLIGMVSNKTQTKNGNVLIEIEDLTGKIKCLVSSQKEDLIKIVEDVALDSVLGFKGTGNGEIIFLNEILFPETVLQGRKQSPLDESVLFLGDLHYGSKNFMSKSFDKFLEYINQDPEKNPEIKKIKYIFLVGDLITGVGNYPNQEKDLLVSDLEEQFVGLANLLKKIPSRIKIIISPGNHDGVRIMEPQPILDESYAWPLYELENVVITENPAVVNIGSTNLFEGFDILTYHGFSFPFYANNISQLMKLKAMDDPIQIMKYLLKNRHLAPTHGSTQYFPCEKDGLIIRKSPDIFVSGHTHKAGVTYENNVLVISASTWEGLTPYQEKFGNKPDHCKVPLFNLKNRSIKILDFETEQEGIKIYSEVEK